jgi:hypothetical protein
MPKVTPTQADFAHPASCVLLAFASRAGGMRDRDRAR